MAQRASHHQLTARRLLSKAEDTEQQAAMLRALLNHQQRSSPDTTEPEPEVNEEEDHAPLHVNAIGQR
jgi:hypothetical protein